MHVVHLSGVWELGTEGTIWFAVIAAIISGLGAGGAVLSALMALTSRKRARSAKGQVASDSLDDKIKSLRDLAEMLRLMAADVTAEAEAQVRVAEGAAKEARENEKLASLTREEAEAVSEIFAEQGRTSIRESKRLGWVSLVIGIIMSNVVAVAVTVLLTMSMK